MAPAGPAGSSWFSRRWRWWSGRGRSSAAARRTQRPGRANRDQRRAGRELGCLAADSADGAGNVIVTGAPKSRGLSFAGGATTGRPRPTDEQTAAITEATRSADHPR
jgi:hypothetical protein